MDVSENSGTPKSSILVGFSIINHPFWGAPIFGNIQIMVPESFGLSFLDFSWQATGLRQFFQTSSSTNFMDISPLRTTLEK